MSNNYSVDEQIFFNTQLAKHFFLNNTTQGRSTLINHLSRNIQDRGGVRPLGKVYFGTTPLVKLQCINISWRKHQKKFQTEDLLKILKWNLPPLHIKVNFWIFDQKMVLYLKRSDYRMRRNFKEKIKNTKSKQCYFLPFYDDQTKKAVFMA